MNDENISEEKLDMKSEFVGKINRMTRYNKEQKLEDEKLDMNLDGLLFQMPSVPIEFKKMYKKYLNKEKKLMKKLLQVILPKYYFYAEFEDLTTCSKCLNLVDKKDFYKHNPATCKYCLKEAVDGRKMKNNPYHRFNL